MRIMDNWDNHGQKIFTDLPDEIPNEKLSEDWALHIHSQSLERLNERGGMAIMELIMNLKRWNLNELISKFGYNYKPTQQDVNLLKILLYESPSVTPVKTK